MIYFMNDADITVLFDDNSTDYWDCTSIVFDVVRTSCI